MERSAILACFNLTIGFRGLFQGELLVSVTTQSGLGP